MNDEIQEYINWAEAFDLADDGLKAFRAINALEAIRFELAVRGEGYIDRIQGLAEEA